MSLPKLNENLNFEIEVPSLKTKVKARPYLAKEEKILLFASESKDPQKMFDAMVQVVGNTLELPCKVEELALFDIEYCFMQLRAISVGEVTTINVACSKCEATNEEVDVNVQETTLNIKGSMNPKIDMGGGIQIELGYPRIRDIKENNIINAMVSEAGPGATEMFAFMRTVVRKVISGDEQFVFENSPRSEQEHFIESFTAEQMNKVLDFIKTMPTPHLDIKFECSECGHENVQDVRGVQSFFS